MTTESSRLKQFEDKEVQTVIKVYPFILDHYSGKAQVTSDKKFCTVVSAKADEDSKSIYNALRYCPYQEIKEKGYIRELALPRKRHLTFTVAPKFRVQDLKQLSLCDDDGAAELFSDLLKRLEENEMPPINKRQTQTDLPYEIETKNCKLASGC